MAKSAEERLNAMGPVPYDDPGAGAAGAYNEGESITNHDAPAGTIMSSKGVTHYDQFLSEDDREADDRYLGDVDQK